MAPQAGTALHEQVYASRTYQAEAVDSRHPTAMTDALRTDVVRPNEVFWKIVSASQKRPIPAIQEEFNCREVMAWDPGETTGQAVLKNGVIYLSQIETKDVGQGFLSLQQELSRYNIDHIRAEEYRVYSWLADSHSNQELHTPQLIGAIKVLALQHSIPLSFKMAQHAKAFWNDSNLKASALYSPGMKHARDALRHLLFYLTFPDKAD